MRDGRVGFKNQYGIARCVRLRLANRTYRATFSLAFELAVDSAFDVAFESNSHVALPIVWGGKWIRKVRV